MFNKDFIKKLYAMTPLERICQDCNTSWLRVPGGWVYGDMRGTVFIPFDNEFMDK